ncbi:MAG TPA: histidine phosphatase family protein [Woeseiaceae bacterium]|nr:histidine phosphatase family protein [Woeseiaceae bacterium]
MKTLTIVRHAKSSWNDMSHGDKERPLNSRGKQDAPAMGRRIAAAGIRPSLIISSPAVRAWSTARAVARELTYPLEFLQRENALYLAGVDDILDVIAAQDNGFNNLMLFGHNPGLTEFANFLSPGVCNNLPTAGVVAVTIDQDNWQLHTQPATRLLLYDFPKSQSDDTRPQEQP